MRPDRWAFSGGALIRRVAWVAIALGFSGCATVENGSLDDVSVVTIPAGASIYASSGTICTSPCAVSGPRKEDIGITITKAGYVTQYVTAASKPGASLAAAQTPTLTSDALGRFIDIQDGAHFKHVPANFVIKLERTP